MGRRAVGPMPGLWGRHVDSIIACVDEGGVTEIHSAKEIVVLM